VLLGFYLRGGLYPDFDRLSTTLGLVFDSAASMARGYPRLGLSLVHFRDGVGTLEHGKKIVKSFWFKWLAEWLIVLILQKKRMSLAHPLVC